MKNKNTRAGVFAIAIVIIGVICALLNFILASAITLFFNVFSAIDLMTSYKVVFLTLTTIEVLLTVPALVKTWHKYDE